ncbi:hypothetical protein [Halopseudomonas aestusnigri]|uniref:DUF2066 domain-containing protein n=1 Tax=Halopseudomonas aestusnigri TaxID=857252 RepID=A0AAQ1G785_9GAMM|nr:hypothetical protein [Halopseudomonas aestusnigri]OWL89336.1 hypothetical protein B7O88_08665 [Halopseudomonas aestusnigri]SEG10141.1 hypothetical protein SAMN05216586_103216 [Halopseudomonas aestusnigri]
MRIFFAVLCVIVLQGLAHAQPATDEYDYFMSEELRLLSSADGAELMSQVNMGVNSAAKIQPFLPAQQLAEYRRIFNSGVAMAGFPMTETQQLTLNVSINEALAGSDRVSVAELSDAQTVMYSAISVNKLDDASAVLEVLVGVADWPAVRERKEEGPVAALAKSTVWVSVFRKNVVWDDVSLEGQLSYPKIEADVLAAHRSQIDKVLLAF